MNKEERDAEINRIVDVGTADENARLNVMELCPACEAAERLYCPPEHRERKVTTEAGDVEDELRSLEQGTYHPPVAPERDAYLEMLEAAAPEEEAALVLGTPHRSGRKEEILRVVDQIRSRVMSHEGQARSDVGYLLEVIDAYESGRL